MTDDPHPRHRRLLCLLVDNEPGVLARVVGLLSARGFNIEALTVSETKEKEHVSRITLVTHGTPQVIRQIRAQLERLIPVHVVVDLSDDASCIERDLALIKIMCIGGDRAEVLQLAEAFGAQIVDATPRSLTVEITGRCRKIESFIALMRPLGLADVTRTGVTAINRGDTSLFGRAQGTHA